MEKGENYVTYLAEKRGRRDGITPSRERFNA